MKNPETVRAVGVLNIMCSKEYCSNNLALNGQKDKSTGASSCPELARRDAKALAHLITKGAGVQDIYQTVYTGLKRLHGKDFERLFQKELSNQRGL